MDLDGYALPIKKLKGTEPVESLDLSHKGLGVASAIVIASLIGVNGALTSVKLRDRVVTHHLHRNASYLARAGAGDSCKQ